MAVRSVILGTGSSAPAKRVTNDDLAGVMDTSDAWIVQRTGIRERRMTEPGETWSDFTLPGCLAALDDAGVKAGELDMIIAGTMTGDMIMPSPGCTIQALLGANRAAAVAVSAACSGFIQGVTIADRFIRVDPSLKILVIGSEHLSNRLDYDDRSVSVLFGDGGGAVVMGSTTEDRGVLSTRIYSDGSLWELLYIEGGLSKNPAYFEASIKPHAIKMRGNELFKVAVKTLEQASLEVIEEAGLTPADVDKVIPHQANVRIIQAVAQRLGLPMEKFFLNLDRYGNTSAGTIPLALDEAVKSGWIERGEVVLMPVFGGGITWGATVMRW